MHLYIGRLRCLGTFRSILEVIHFNVRGIHDIKSDYYLAARTHLATAVASKLTVGICHTFIHKYIYTFIYMSTLYVASSLFSLLEFSLLCHRYLDYRCGYIC